MIVFDTLFILLIIYLFCSKLLIIYIIRILAKKGNDNEFMLDYIELVPKSVYGVTDEGAMEDML